MSRNRPPRRPASARLVGALPPAAAGVGETVQGTEGIGHRVQIGEQFVQQQAQLVLDRLESGRDVYLEYSNEVWNGIFSQGGWVEQQGQAQWPSDPASGFTKRINWHGLRTAQVCDLWKTVWAGQAGRIHCVMGSQAANSWTASQALSCPLWSQGPCATHGIDAVAIAPYFGGYLGDPSMETTVEGWTGEPDGGLQMESYAVHANDGGLIEARRSRFRDDSAGNADIRMQLRTTDAAGDGQSSLLAYNNLIETGSITLSAANSGGPPTSVRADLVNNTVLAPAGDPAIGIVTQPAGIGQVSLLAYNNFLRGNGGIIHFIGPANGVVGDWDANGYDVDVATANSLTPGAGPDAVISGTAFLDPAEGDYRHAFGSPMIDAGDDNAPDVPVTDFEGRPRPLGPATDIGAFESPDWIMLDGFETPSI